MSERLRASGRFVMFLVYLVAYLFESSVGRLWIKNIVARRQFHTRVVSKYCRIATRLMGFRVHATDLPPLEKHYLLVGNHLGFMDILVLSSVRPCLFVTSVEMRETPLLGTLCEMGGCLFVERRSRANIINETLEIRDALQQGFNIALYPEGTSGSGERVLPFKKSLLTAAAGTGVPIKVMVINYRKVNGEAMSMKWRDHVCWYGDMAFLPALWRLFCLKHVDVELSFHDEIHVHSEEDRREVSMKAQATVEKYFAPIAPVKIQEMA